MFPLIREIRLLGIFTALLAVLCTVETRAQLNPAHPATDFPQLVDEIVRRTATGRVEAAPAAGDDLREWRKAFNFFRFRSLDSCRRILARYNYELVRMPDGKSGNTYDVIRELVPVRRGWGTFIFNPGHTKRLYVQVAHPLHDDRSAGIGAELFRKTGAEWLLIAGTDRSESSTDDELSRLNEQLFQQWHEMLTDLVHVTVSVHTFNSQAYPAPIDTTDLVVSNARTTDEQWGISQLSLALRDTLRAARISCSLAMYDSGFARLSGAGSRTGTFTNDSVGFGHWINLEVASRVPKDPSRSAKLVAALSKALDITGQKVSREVNAAFGLVSPRVLRVDAEHKLLFPPPPGDQYRIISFDSREVKHDTVVIRVGDWVDLGGSPGAGPKISGLDARDGNFMQRFGSGARNSRPGSARIVEKPAPQVFLTERSPKGLPASDGDNDPGAEPLQVQRIPLEPLQSSVVSSDYLAGVTPFRWQGAVASGFSPSARVFQLGTGESPVSEFTSPAHLLIPVMNNSYGQGRTKFVGVQMTAMLVNQITRLTDASHAQRDVSLLAEQDEQGRFFLRIFPAKAGEQRKPPSKR